MNRNEKRRVPERSRRAVEVSEWHYRQGLKMKAARAYLREARELARDICDGIRNQER
jgi:hypothetical protein